MSNKIEHNKMEYKMDAEQEQLQQQPVKRGRGRPRKSAEHHAQKNREYCKNYYYKVAKPANERKARVASILDNLKSKTFSFIIISLMPDSMAGELKLITETAASLNITDYDINNLKRAQIKAAIHSAWYNKLAERVLTNFDTFVESLGDSVEAGDKEELKKRIADFITAKDSTWIDTLAPSSIISNFVV